MVPSSVTEVSEGGLWLCFRVAPCFVHLKYPVLHTLKKNALLCLSLDLFCLPPFPLHSTALFLVVGSMVVFLNCNGGVFPYFQPVLSPIHEVTFKSARFSYRKVWMLASRSTVAQIKDTVLFWGESLTKLSFVLKSSHRKDVFFSTNQITVPCRS